MQKEIEHAKLKQIVTNRSSETFIVIDRYNQYTGLKEDTIERPVNMQGLTKKINDLENELSILKNIEAKIKNKQFDQVDDRRTHVRESKERSRKEILFNGPNGSADSTEPINAKILIEQENTDEEIVE